MNLSTDNRGTTLYYILKTEIHFLFSQVVLTFVQTRGFLDSEYKVVTNFPRRDVSMTWRLIATVARSLIIASFAYCTRTYVANEKFLENSHVFTRYPDEFSVRNLDAQRYKNLKAKNEIKLFAGMIENWTGVV